jgi:hypothetical protein
MTIPIRLTLYIIYITPINCYPISSPPHLKQLQEVSLFYFIYLNEVHQTHTFTLISFIQTPPPIRTIPHTHGTYFTVPFSLFELMFKGLSQCIPAMSILWSIQSLPLLSLTPLTPTPIFQQFSIHILISFIFIDVMFYDISDVLSFSFSFLLSLYAIE